MKKIRIIPTKLQGEIHVPSSKSMGHREIICAGLSAGTSIIDNISMSKDIEATIRCLRSLGIRVDNTTGRIPGRIALKIMGSGRLYKAGDIADCGESGSTLRFFIPLGMLLDAPFTFVGHGKLISRPLQAYYDIFDGQGLEYTLTDGQLPLTLNGRLKAGNYKLPGNVSSQFVSGLLFALPLLDADSIIEITSTLESSAYVDMTLSCLNKYGIKVKNNEHRSYEIKGRQHYMARNSDVEGDWSQAAFWMVGGSIGNSVTCRGMDVKSLQGDKAIVEIMQRMGTKFIFDDSGITTCESRTKATIIDGSECPDIIPVLSALAAVSEGTTEIINAGRLRIKECDRLAAMTDGLNRLGGQVTELQNGLRIEGHPEGLLGGVEVDAWNDHRIAMSMAIVAQKCKNPIILTDADSVQKSYPDFWKDYAATGGRIEVLL